VALAVAAPVCLALAAGPAAAATPRTGGGDPYYPLQGNGGYDVTHYDLTLGYSPARHHLRGTARITATATTGLGVFDLDLRRSLAVRSVRVDGRRAHFSQPRRLHQELVVRPRRPVASGTRFTVVVRYAGRPRAVHDPDGSVEGWVATDDGAFVVGEPQGSPSWFPCNDTPRDKATYTFRVTVPTRLTAVANGELSRITVRRHGRHTFVWRSREPMATYLATATVGRFDVRTGTTPGGVPYYVATDPTLTRASRTVLSRLPAITDYLAGLLGPYPFSSTGAVVDDAPEVGYALENQTKPLYDSPPDELTLAHEQAHMWFGDSVTLSRWRDIWVNEGFAEFLSWMWSEHSGGRSAQQFFDRLYAKKSSSGVWHPPPASPGGPADIFDSSVYERGAMALQALRVELGDATFFPMLRDWHSSRRYGSASVADFTAYASAYSGRDLSHFFDVWLYQDAKPTSW
jgi:aminopeptidase N